MVYHLSDQHYVGCSSCEDQCAHRNTYHEEDSHQKKVCVVSCWSNKCGTQVNSRAQSHRISVCVCVCVCVCVSVRVCVCVCV